MRDERLLKRLPPLEGLHLTTPNMAEVLLSTPSERLIEVTRITGALAITSFPGLISEAAVWKAAAIVREASVRRYPRGPATLTIVSTPYHWLTYPKPAVYSSPDPNCVPDPNCIYGGASLCEDDPRQTCMDSAEVDLYETQIENIKSWLDGFNTYYGASVQIGQQFVDCERWVTRASPASWNDAVREKHNLIYNRGKLLLPDLRIYRWNRGAIAKLGPGEPYTEWADEFYTLLEEFDAGDGDIYDLSLYTMPDFKRTVAMLRATTDQARDNSVEIVVPWIALACGFIELGAGKPFDPDLDYGTRALRNVAKFLRRDDYAEFWTTRGIYPEPFSPGTPRWLQYFIEYVRASTE